LLLATGCGDDDSKGDGSSEVSCALEISLSGAVEFESSPGYFSCGFGTLIGDSFLVFFFAKGDGDVDINLQGDVAPGETGVDFGAYLDVDHADGRAFNAFGCRIDLVENSFVRSTSNWEEYHLEGSGTCSEPATSDTGESVTISPFAFAANAGWEPGAM
jgi:hypothetical protein